MKKQYKQLHTEALKRAKEFPNKIAIHDIATGKDLTYKQLIIFSLILAKRIKKLGELRIGILVPNSAGCYASFLGSLFAGVTPVMINYATGAEKNCLYAKSVCGFDYILTSKNLVNKIKMKPLSGMIFIEDIVPTITIKEKTLAFFRYNFFTVKNDFTPSEETAVILFTSGSEKEPKGVMLSHKNILSNLEGVDNQFGFTEKEIFVSVLPVFHVFGLTTSFLLPLTLGCENVVHPSPLEYEKVVKSIRKYAGTVFPATPTFFLGYFKKAERGDFASLKYPIAGGDKLPSKIRDIYLKEHGITIYEGYGTTETSPVVSCNCEKHIKHGSIGKPLPGVQVKIVNLETDEKVKPNIVGKILVKGDLVMKGYFDDLEQTSLHIRGGWYDTGDMGLLDEEGFLWHKGRLKRFIKIAGEMISLVAVENELEKCMPENSLCCVVEQPHPTRGAEIIAVVTVEVDKKEIREKLKKVLAPILMPKKYIYMKDLPFLGNGKVDFREVTKIVRTQY